MQLIIYFHILKFPLAQKRFNRYSFLSIPLTPNWTVNSSMAQNCHFSYSSIQPSIELNSQQVTKNNSLVISPIENYFLETIKG